MARPKKQDKVHSVSVTIYEDQERMANALVEQGFFSNVSDLVRNGIVQLYSEKIGNTEQDLIREKNRLMEVCEQLEQLQKNTEWKMKCLVDKYSERRRRIGIKGIASYEDNTKKWIEENMNTINMLFPMKSVDEIYDELEQMIKVKK